MRRRWLLGVVVAAAAAWASTAGAHTLLQSGWTYTDADLCVEGSAATQHPPSGGYSGVQVNAIQRWSAQFGPDLGCTGTRYLDPGWMALWRRWWVWRNNRWEECNNSGWVYNSSRTWTLHHQREFATAICGASWYGTTGYGYVYEYVGGWKGGETWSGYHWLPS